MTAADTAGSVLIEVEKDSTLIKAAKAFFKPQPNPAEIRLIMADYKRFDSSGIEVDLDFAALPIGFGSRMLADLATRKDGRTLADLRTFLAGLFKPDSSPNFLIRGFVKTAETLDRLAKDKADSVLIFHSDASIVGMLAPPDPTCGTSLAVGDTETVRKKLHARTLADFGLDGSNVALAIVDSGIYLPRITQLLGDMKPSGFQPKIDKANSWKQHVVTEPFGHRLGHGTMCAYDALIAAPNATLLDYAILLGRPSDESRLKTTLAAAALAYGRLLNLLLFGPWPYDALVVSNSWGAFHPSEDTYPKGSVNRYIDNPNHILHLWVWALALVGADVIFAGNNCGCCCPAPACMSQTAGMIMGANSYAEGLTVGGCDTRDELVGYSSRGPSIAGMPPEKPDLVAYTHFLGSKTRRMFVPDTGVSAACPVAAGCVAALRTRLKPATVPSAILFDTLRSTATKVIGPGWDPGYGHGIINPTAAAVKLNLIP